MPYFDIETKYRLTRCKLSTEAARLKSRAPAPVMGPIDKLYQGLDLFTQAVHVAGSESILIKIPPTTERA